MDVDDIESRQQQADIPTPEDIGRWAGKTGVGAVMVALSQILPIVTPLLPPTWAQWLRVAGEVLVVVGLVHKGERLAEMVDAR